LCNEKINCGIFTRNCNINKNAPFFIKLNIHKNV
jgi:hypothetical protein